MKNYLHRSQRLLNCLIAMLGVVGGGLLWHMFEVDSFFDDITCWILPAALLAGYVQWVIWGKQPSA